MNDCDNDRNAQLIESDSKNEPSVHELLNEATVWLQYARGVTATLADLVHEAEGLDGKQLGLSLEAIVAMTQAGLERLGQAHAKWTFDCASGRLRP